MMNVRFIAFLVMIFLFCTTTYYLLDASVIAWFSKLSAIGIAFLKGVWSRFSWEALPVLFGKWLTKTLFRLVFVHVPMTIIKILIMTALLSPRAKRRWLRIAVVIKQFGLELYQAILRRFRAYFGNHAIIAFLLSAVVTIVIFVVTLIWFGFGLISWGPLVMVWSWLSAIISGVIHTVPGLPRLFEYIRKLWETKVKERYPRVVAAHRRFMIRVVRVAIKARLLRTGAQDRVRRRIRQKQRELVALAQARLMSSSGKGMPWEDFAWSGQDLSAMVEQRSVCVADRAYARMLGADLRLSLAEGARACGRPSQHGINRH